MLAPLLPATAKRRLARSPRQRALTISVIEAISVGAWFAVLELVSVPVLKALGASTQLIGAQLTITCACVALISALAAPLIRSIGGGKRTVVVLSTAQALLSGLVAIPLLCAGSPFALPAAYVLLLLNAIIGPLNAVAWLGWMGSLIPRHIRGRYMTRRNRLFHLSKALSAGAIAVLPMLIIGAAVGSEFAAQHAAGPATSASPAISATPTVSASPGAPSSAAVLASAPAATAGTAFAATSAASAGAAALPAGVEDLVRAHPSLIVALLLIGMCSRLFSAWLLAHQPELPDRTPPRAAGSLLGSLHEAGVFLRSAHRHDLGRWFLLWALFQAGALMLQTFYVPFLILAPEEGGLHLSWPWFVLLTQVSFITRLFLLPTAGVFIDRYGPHAMFRLAAFGITILPAWWALWPSLPSLIVAEIMSGMCWCLADASAGVVTMSCHKDPVERQRLVGIWMGLTSLAHVAGAGLATALFAVLPPFEGSVIRTVFLASFAARFPVLILALWWLPRGGFSFRHRTFGLWRLIPGADPMVELGRPLLRFFSRDEDERPSTPPPAQPPAPAPPPSPSQRG